MQVTAQLNYLRIAPRKVRGVAKIIKGLPVEEAKSQLDYLLKKPARPLRKLLDSVISNAVNNHGLQKDYLYIREITVDEGMKLKRFMPKGFGRTAPIQKKTSRIKVVLDELPEEKRKMIKSVKGTEILEKEKVEKLKEVEEKPKRTSKLGVKKELVKAKKEGAFGGIKNFSKKLFRRKAI